MDIVRNGESLVLEDGSLQLVEEEKEGGSGSGEAPTRPTGRFRRVPSSYLAPLNSLPPLPADVDEVVLNWDASANVSGGTCPSLENRTVQCFAYKNVKFKCSKTLLVDPESHLGALQAKRFHYGVCLR